MNYAEAMIYLEGTDRFGSRLGLERMQQLLTYLGLPEQKIPTIHIAGTNGKGSTAAYSAYMLAAAGKRVGLYCSPYVYNFGERIRVLDGRDPEAPWAENPLAGQISPDCIADTLTTLREVIEAHGLTGQAHPTHFEMLTLMAFLHFRNSDCDVLVLETGLGGRLDSTNVIPPPDVAVITAIGLDHQARLGNTLVEIAGEKAGILKQGTKTLCLYDQAAAIRDPEESRAVTDLFFSRAKALSIHFNPLRHSDIEVLERSLNGQTFRFRPEGETRFHTTMLPAFEPDNAALAILAVRALLPEIAQADMARGIEACYWPARLEKLGDKPISLLDGSHNPQGAEALRGSLNLLFEPEVPEIHVCSIMKDKDRPQMFRNVLAGNRVRVLYVTAPEGVPRAESPQMLAAVATEIVRELGVSTEVRQALSVDQAVSEALSLCDQLGAVLVGWGTFYQANEFRDAMGKRGRL